MAAIPDRTLWTALREAADLQVRARLAVAIALSVLLAANAALAPIALKLLVDGLAPGAISSSAMTFGALYVAAMAMGRAGGALQAHVFATADRALQTRFSGQILRRLLRLPMRYHLSESPGALMQMQAHALHGIQLILSLACFTLLPTLVQMLVILTVVGSLFNVWIWSIIAFAIVGYLIAFTAGTKRLSGASHAALSADATAGKMFADALSNIESVKAFTAEGQIAGRHEGLLAVSRQNWVRCSARRAETGIMTAGIFLATAGGILYFGASAVAGGRMTVGDFILLNAYLIQIVAPLEATGFAVRDLSQAIAYLDRWRATLRVPTELQGNHGQARPHHADAPTLEFKNVRFGYQAAIPVLQDVSFRVRSGGCTAILGPSGAGKSSLLRLLQGHCAPDSGGIEVDGNAIDSLELIALRQRISIVTQDVTLFHDTLRHNLLFARPEADESALRDAIHRSGLERTIASLPAGLDAIVGERGLKLSGGEKQRVAIARALLRDTDILLLDEPTSALDADTEGAVCDALMRAARGRTTLIVTHSLQLASRADAIVVLDHGRVAEKGAHVDLLAANGPYAQLWRHTHDLMCRKSATAVMQS